MIKAPGNRNGKPTRACFVWCGKQYCDCNPGGAINSERIFLIGLPGVGKSKNAEEIAKSLNILHVDLDKEIERIENMTIVEMFNISEEYFRENEQKMLKFYANIPASFVMSVGGGTACYQNNIDIMNDAGSTIYLTAPLEIIAKRILNDNIVRPMFKDLNEAEILEKLQLLQVERQSFYEKAKEKRESN